MPSRPSPAPRAAPPRRLRRFLKRLALAVGITVVLFGVIVYVALTRFALVAPAWWKPPNPADPRTLEAARAVENGVTTLLHQRHAPEQTWTMSLSSEDANAWLAARLKEWVANQDGSWVWPAELSSLQVEFRDGQVTLGVGLMYRGAVRVVSLSVSPRMDEAGALWLPATSVAIGKLSVPVSWALSGKESLLREYLPIDAATNAGATRVFDALAGKGPISSRPTMKLSDGRRVQIVGIRSESGKLLVTCRPAPEEQ